MVVLFYPVLYFRSYNPEKKTCLPLVLVLFFAADNTQQKQPRRRFIWAYRLKGHGVSWKNGVFLCPVAIQSQINTQRLIFIITVWSMAQAYY